jgi:hypothetical protein
MWPQAACGPRAVGWRPIFYTSGSQSGRYRPLGGGGITEVGANRYERWKWALLSSQGALVDK